MDFTWKYALLSMFRTPQKYAGHFMKHLRILTLGIDNERTSNPRKRSLFAGLAMHFAFHFDGSKEKDGESIGNDENLESLLKDAAKIEDGGRKEYFEMQHSICHLLKNDASLVEYFHILCLWMKPLSLFLCFVFDKRRCEKGLFCSNGMHNASFLFHTLFFVCFYSFFYLFLANHLTL